MAMVTGPTLSGTFTGTGASSSIYCRQGSVITLNFGTGTVVLRRKGPDGTFVPTSNSWSADAVETIVAEGEYDLNCTAYTADIVYAIEASRVNQNA